ncbi:MAG: hypothetical protein E6J19_14135 [Chloroflexi bacterium]|nr:MAG: hypothetical protein E6J19_14135 [Chloroflexota bacterium]
MEWIVVFVLVLIVATLFVLRRSGWSSGFTFAPRRFQDDLTLRTRIAEDEARDAINRRDEDPAP